jgi:hypothetical protein
MGNETTYLGVMGRLIRLISALNANAADLDHLAGGRLHLAKIATDVERITQQQAALTVSKQEASKQLQKLLVEGQRSEKLAELGMQPFRGRKARTPKTSTTSEPTAPAPTPAPPTALLAADANSKQ